MDEVQIEPGGEDDALFEEAKGNFREGDLQAAREKLRRLAAKYPSDHRVAGNLGYVYQELKEATDAHDCFRRAAALNPEEELWSIGLFHSLWRLGHTDEAFREARRFRSLGKHAPLYSQLLEDMREEFVAKGWMSDLVGRDDMEES